MFPKNHPSYNLYMKGFGGLHGLYMGVYRPCTLNSYAVVACATSCPEVRDLHGLAMDFVECSYRFRIFSNE